VPAGTPLHAGLPAQTGLCQTLKRTAALRAATANGGFHRFSACNPPFRHPQSSVLPHEKILFLLFTIVGTSFPAHAKCNIQKSQDYTQEKGFTIQKDLSYPLFLAMQAMKEKGLDLNNYLITYSENITKPDII